MVSTEMLRKLADIGFMATGGGLFRQAEIIFQAVKLNRENNILPYMGLALNLMNMNKCEEALNILEKKALVLEPDNDTLHAFVGMALMLLGRSRESEKCLNRVVEESDDDLACNLAKNLLQHLRNKSS